MSKQDLVDPVGTYAFSDGNDIHLRVRLPVGRDLPSPSVRLRHRRTDRMIEAVPVVESSGEGLLLTFEVPRADLSPGLWWVALKADEAGEFRRIQARLLLDPRQPVVLLAGRPPETKMAPPAPRAARQPAAGQVHQRATATVDRVLRHLPENRAVRYRSGLARVARLIRL